MGGAEPDGQRKQERARLGRAPSVVVDCANDQDPEEIDWIEQVLATGAACVVPKPDTSGAPDGMPVGH